MLGVVMVLAVSLLLIGILYYPMATETIPADEEVAAAMFRDHHNPTEEELRMWAQKEELHMPEQDWAYMLTADDTHREVIDVLAADPTCPKRKFFIFCKTLLDERER